MDITHQIIVFDATDIDAESAFRAGMLGGTVDAGDDWHTVSDGAGTPRVGVQLAPGHEQQRCTSTCRRRPGAARR